MKNITTEVKDTILIVCLNRPEKRNAVSNAMISEVEQIFTRIPKHIKSAVIYGAGKHFCAGLDLSEMTEHNTLLKTEKA